MSRLSPLPYEEWDLSALADASPGMTPPRLTVLELFAHHPELARAFLSYNRYLGSRRSTIPRRPRELAILRVAWRRRCRYEWAQHLLIARKAGIGDDEIARLRSRSVSGDDDVAVISRAVDELDADSRLSDETHALLSASFDERQLMDLVFTIGTYCLLAMAFNTFGLELDPGLSDEGFDTDSSQKGT